MTAGVQAFLRRPSLDDKPACERYRRELLVGMQPRIRVVMETVRRNFPFEAPRFTIFVLDTADQIARVIAEACYQRVGDRLERSSCSCGNACRHTMVTVALPAEYAVGIFEHLGVQDAAASPLLTPAHVRVAVIAAGGFGVSQIEPVVQAFSRVVAGGQA